MTKFDNQYSGIIDVLVKTRRFEGVAALWKGFAPYLARTGPATVVTLMLMDALMTNYHRVCKNN